jgi:uncharacterized membrane protein
MAKKQQNENPQMAKIVERNINALLLRKQEEERKRTFQERLIDRISTFAGSMVFVIIHLIFFGSWIVWNLGLIHLKPFDPTFVILATFAAVEAIFLTTFILLSQNRTNALADKRAELDLQIGLLTEYELTRVMVLVQAIAKKLDIKEAKNEEMEELLNDIHPENVMDSLDNSLKDLMGNK